jgi:hypothetical protein
MPRYANLLIFIVLLALAAFALTLMPQGFDTDVSQVGQGRPAAVLVHDHGLVRSTELMDALGAVRAEFEPDKLFIVADVHHPRGQAFVEAHGLPRVALVLFDADGALVAEHVGNTDRDSVRRFLELLKTQ